jgi:hypothetical protein
LRGHCNQILLYNKKNKVRDASRARFDRLACLTGSLAKYVMPKMFASEPRLFHVEVALSPE